MPQTKKNPVKPGVNSSEFWISAILSLVGAALAAYGAAKGNDVLVGLGSGLAGIVGGAYTLGRAKVKAAADGS